MRGFIKLKECGSKKEVFLNVDHIILVRESTKFNKDKRVNETMTFVKLVCNSTVMTDMPYAEVVEKIENATWQANA